VPQPGVATAHPELAAEAVTTLEAMASLAGQTATVVHVVAVRQPGLVERAHAVAQVAGVGISVDLMSTSVRVRFDGRPDR
jgi:hypothetical protein